MWTSRLVPRESCQPGRVATVSHQGFDVAAHAFAPGSGVWVELGRVDDAVPGGAQGGGRGMEQREVQVQHVGHWPAELDAFHAASVSCLGQPLPVKSKPSQGGPNGSTSLPWARASSR